MRKEIDLISSTWIGLPKRTDALHVGLATTLALGWEATLYREELALKKVPIRKLKSSECNIMGENFLYCVEADAAFYDVKIFISLSKIRILFCIF